VRAEGEHRTALVPDGEAAVLLLAPGASAHGQTALPGDGLVARALHLAGQVGGGVLPADLKPGRPLTYEAEKQSQGGTGANQHRPGCTGPAEQTGKSCHPAKTEEKLAAEFKVSPRTIRNDADFTGAVDTLAKNCGEGVRQQILSRETPLTRKDIMQLARKEPEEQRRALKEATANGGKKTRSKSRETPNQAKAEQATFTVPRAPQPLAKSLLRQLGRKAAAEVHRALGQLLGRQTPEPVRGRLTSRGRGVVEAR
jgi:hypothetical protein